MPPRADAPRRILPIDCVIESMPHAADLAHTYMQAPESDWLVALLLSPTDEVIEVFVIAEGRECPWRRRWELAPLIDAARRCDATSVVTAEWHHHRWSPASWTDEIDVRLAQMRLDLKAAGCPHRNHAILDALGYYRDFSAEVDCRGRRRGSVGSMAVLLMANWLIC